MSPESPSAPFGSRAKLRREVLVRSAIVLAVFAMGLLAFSFGAEVSERDVRGAGLLAHAYHSIGLFVMGGMDLGLPSGGPVGARALLWGAYFAAPLVTVVALIQAFALALARQARDRRPLDQHIVLVGQGRLGRLYQEVIHRVEPERMVVVVDAEPGERPDNTRTSRHVHGDVRDPAVQARLQLERAEAVMLMTSDDLVNLEAATAVAEAVPRLANRVVVHLSDLGLKRLISQKTSPVVGGQEGGTVFLKMGENAGASAASGILSTSRDQLINSHRIAARHLVLRELLPIFARTEEKDTVVIAGFGGFGQTILEILQREAAGRFDTVVVVDPQAPARVRQYVDQVGIPDDGYRLVETAGDLLDPQTWASAAAALEGGLSLSQATFVVGTPDDGHNIRVGLWLDERFPDAHHVLRCFHESVFTRRLAERQGFHICGEARLLVASLEERHRLWFGSG